METIDKVSHKKQYSSLNNNKFKTEININDKTHKHKNEKSDICNKFTINIPTAIQTSKKHRELSVRPTVQAEPDEEKAHRLTDLINKFQTFYEKNLKLNRIRSNSNRFKSEYESRPKSLTKKDRDFRKINEGSISTEASLFRGRLDDYAIGKEIGKGGYAVVKESLHKPSNKKVAIKVYEKDKLHDQQRKNFVKREIQILKKVDNNYIVRLHEVIETTKHVKYLFLFRFFL